MRGSRSIGWLVGVFGAFAVASGVACEPPESASEAVAQKTPESDEPKSTSASDESRRAEAETERAEESDENRRDGEPGDPKAVAEVPPGFVFGGHPHDEETIELELYGAADTEIPARAEPRPSAEVVGQYQLGPDEKFEIRGARTVIDVDPFESPVAFVIGEGAKHIEGPGHALPVEVERGASIAVARKYRGEGMSDSYIWYDGSVYVNPNDCCLKLVDPEVMESDAGFANRKARVVPDREGTVYEALGLLGHQSFSTASDSSSWWGRVELSGEKKGWIRMDREEIRVEKCFPNFCKEVGVGAD